jgi:hypothetical protein
MAICNNSDIAEQQLHKETAYWNLLASGYRMLEAASGHYLVDLDRGGTQLAAIRH